MRRVWMAAVLAACASDDGDAPDPGGALDGGGADMAGPLADMGEMALDDMAGGDLAVEPGPTGVQPGDVAPNFALLDADGEQVALADFRGDAVLVAGASAW